MSNASVIPFSATLFVRDACLCLHAQRAARALARLFDNALKPVGINNGQFSLLMSLNRRLESFRSREGGAFAFADELLSKKQALREIEAQLAADVDAEPSAQVA